MSRRGRTARVASRQRIETLGNGTSAPTNKTIQTAETGELYFIDHNHASALTITLPPMQDGAYFKFIFKTALTEDGSVVIATSEATAGSIVGSIFEQVTGGSNAASGVDTDDGTDVKITLSDDIHPGSSVECFCDGSVWHAHARLNVSGVGESGFGDYSPPAPPNPPATRFYVGFANGTLSSDDSSPPAPKKTNLVGPIDGGSSDGNAFIGYPSFNAQTNDIVYGKDGSGNPLIVLLTSAATNSLYKITPANFAAATDNSATQITFTGGSSIKQLVVGWGNNVWISAGHLSNQLKNIFRSTDGGTTWDPLSLQTILATVGIAEGGNGGYKIKTLTTDGLGKWWFGIDGFLSGAETEDTNSYIFCSTDDGQNWSLHHTLANSDIYKMVYTNDTLVVTYNYAPPGETAARQAISAAGSATSGASNWGTPVFLSPNGTRDTGNMISTEHKSEEAKRIAAANGRVLVADKRRVLLLTVSGKNITVSDTLVNLTTGVTNFGPNINSIATDGAGNWYVGSDGDGSDGGDIAKNLNSADPADPSSWTNGPTNLGTNRQIRSLAFDRYLPL
jgi:hypothetical protein